MKTSSSKVLYFKSKIKKKIQRLFENPEYELTVRCYNSHTFTGKQWQCPHRSSNFPIKEKPWCARKCGNEEEPRTNGL